MFNLTVVAGKSKGEIGPVVPAEFTCTTKKRNLFKKKEKEKSL